MLPVFEHAGGWNLIVLRGPGADTLSMATHGSDRKGLDEPVANACFEEPMHASKKLCNARRDRLADERGSTEVMTQCCTAPSQCKPAPVFLREVAVYAEKIGKS